MFGTLFPSGCLSLFVLCNIPQIQGLTCLNSYLPIQSPTSALQFVHLFCQFTQNCGKHIHCVCTFIGDLICPISRVGACCCSTRGNPKPVKPSWRDLLLKGGGRWRRLPGEAVITLKSKMAALENG